MKYLFEWQTSFVEPVAGGVDLCLLRGISSCLYAAEAGTVQVIGYIESFSVCGVLTRDNTSLLEVLSDSRARSGPYSDWLDCTPKA